MNKTNIYILTGDVNTGKSTSLTEWCLLQRAKGKRVGGILNPRVNGSKTFIDASSGNQWSMIAEPDDTNPLIIGEYFFSRLAFEKAKTTLETVGHLNPDIVIIDEIGKLEMKDMGLEPSVSNILNKAMIKNCTLVCVVRASLLDSVKSRYSLEGAQVISKEELHVI